LHPEDNNERQSIHEHVSVPLPVKAERRENHLGTAAPGRPAEQGSAIVIPSTNARNSQRRENFQ